MSEVYVAGALKHVPKEWWKIYEKIAAVVKKVGMTPYLPHIDTVKNVRQTVEQIHDPNLSLDLVAEVYEKNIEALRKAKLIIAEVSKPSTGTGFEIGLALEWKKPVICLARNDAAVTSMVLGPVHLNLIKFIRYHNDQEALEKLEGVLRTMFK